jgi:hypothetical protein
MPRRNSEMSDQVATVELQATAVRFLSQGDEAAFFGWLGNLPCVERCEGRGSTLFMKVNSAAVDERGLRELIALFRRYRVGLKQLAVFDRGEFADWFRSEQAYWHKEVFG